ncbi:lytic polysaccharide monooxygenase [Nonomuraea rhodomycinica]|uniref:lytic polysaccharide monooxygenase n=1 Tax=Nonomuraea rhodomycinica TaxID=1712872 RepID=UPI0028A7AD15|nr:lytic polysaccharide monooxygenase [Nonomuraea rhodomycinica]
MHSPPHAPARRWAVRAAAVLTAAVAFLATWAVAADAHGTVVDPASRNYGCWLRWGSDFQAGIPDGRLCSGGHAESGRYDSLDTPGAWKTTDVRTSFTLKLLYQARHGADYLLVYVSRPGFDPTRQAPAWSDMQLLTRTAKFSPGESYTVGLSVPGRTGRALVYTIWQASHLDQAFLLCSDVNFVS